MSRFLYCISQIYVITQLTRQKTQFTPFFIENEYISLSKKPKKRISLFFYYVFNNNSKTAKDIHGP